MPRGRATGAFIGTACLVLVLTAACGASGGKSAAQTGGGPYQVGFDSDLSGKYAVNGVGQRDGFKAYFDYVNAHGGIAGHQVKVTYLDDTSDITRGTANTTQLMTANNVSAVGGYLVSNVCGAAAVNASASKVPIVCSALSDDLLDPVKPYVYSAGISRAFEAQPMIKETGQLSGSSQHRIATLILASAAALSIQKSWEDSVKQNGWTLVDSEQVPLTATDVGPQLAKIVAAKPDAILIDMADTLIVQLVRGLEAAGVTVPVVSTDSASYTGSLVALKAPNFYMLSTRTFDGSGSGKGLTMFRDAAKAAGSDPAKPFYNVGYTQALAIGEGLKACGYPCDGQKMQGSLDKLNVDTGGVTSGALAYKPDNHQALHSVDVYVWDSATGAAKKVASDLPGGVS